MPNLKETPEPIVKAGRVVDYGVFRTPFRKLNLLDAKLPGVPSFMRKFRLKQWQHIALVGQDFMAAFVVLNAGYMSTSFCWFMDRNTGEFFEHHQEKPGGSAVVAKELWHDECRFTGKGYFIEIQNRLDEGIHRAKIDIQPSRGKPGISASLELLEDVSQVQPLIVVLPIFENRPLHTHKMLCPLRGEIQAGDRKIRLDETKDLALLDVQKTDYPYNSFWKWATCAGYDRAGRRIGLNLVQNMIENDDVYNENCLWVDGKLTLWGGARFSMDPVDVLKPWHIETTDKKCILDFTPRGERAERINLGIICSDYHQPYGVFNGTLVDEDGTVYEIQDFFGVTEHHLARF